jgi:hypothetical protein
MSSGNELHVASPVAVAGVVLIPIEKASSFSYAAKNRFWIHCSKEPVAIVVCGAEGVRAFDMEGGERSMRELFRKVAGLEAALEEHCG